MRLNAKHSLGADTACLMLSGDILTFPVRQSGDDGHEMIVLTEWSADVDHAKQRVRWAATNIPSWNDANPVVRYVRVKLIAVEQ